MCSASPRSLLKAALLARAYKCPAMHQTDYAASIWQDPVIIDADTATWQEVCEVHRAALGYANQWVNSREGKKLAAVIYYAIRFNARDRYSLALQVLDQALTKGVAYVLAKISPEAKTFLTRARRVSMELQRVYGFIRFAPAGAGTMVGRAELEHDTGDLIITYFARRYQRQKIILLANGRAHIWDKGKITVTSADAFSADTPADDFNAFWDAYYDSQVIEGRLNKKLARKHLPKKYWSWVEEGRKLLE